MYCFLNANEVKKYTCFIVNEKGCYLLNCKYIMNVCYECYFLVELCYFINDLFDKRVNIEKK